MKLEPPTPAAPDPRPPSPAGVGLYQFGGRRVRLDYERIFPRLGRLPDAVLAAEISAAPSTVRRLRYRFRIRGHDRLAFLDQYLGRIPDRRLHLKFGIARTTLLRRRRKLGIARAPRKAYNADQRIAEYLRLMERTLGS